jgi:hypothetical protein
MTEKYANGKFIKMVQRGMQLAHNKTLRRVEGTQLTCSHFMYEKHCYIVSEFPNKVTID